MVKIKLGLQCELENLDVNKVCFAKWLDILSTIEESRFEPVEYFNWQDMRRKCSHLNSSLTREIDYL